LEEIVARMMDAEAKMFSGKNRDAAQGGEQ
jgi:hypothetical protein